ncbi:MAG TPA: threonine ammonia-lyase [Thermodesulfobacteriaceae bacterium]|nr:threonine ammonia-lyase [Thermodesulfobacteriaceae bacterium]
MAVTLGDIERAAELLRGSIMQTPCTYSKTLSEITGADVFVKFENLQFTASFKDRGALVKLLSLSEEEKERGVIAMSAGNHAQAVAYYARRLGIPAVIVMPRYTPNVKVEHTRAYGAEVILHGGDLSEARAHAEKLAAERRLCMVHPYDDEKIIAGQGTIALEMLEAVPDLEIIVIPVGGGGLISGSAIAAKGIRPGIKIVGVESARFPSMMQALYGLPVTCGRSTIAEGIAVKEPGALTLPIIREYVDKIFTVDEDQIEEAVLLLLEVEKTVAEGAGAVGLAAVRENPDWFSRRKTGLIISGGNIDMTVLAEIIRRGLVRSGRLIRLLVEMRDAPGALADIARHLADSEANIWEIHHQRAFSSIPLKTVEVEFVLEMRGLDHARDTVDVLKKAGYQVRWCR